ncbi:MAG TPA: 3-hydroxybenzoate 4-monooxygenase, partial [Rhabdaerophilum sp.]|nr:3-hydroxybenzoate 4-monooxygenase [Rhabdaerophilum sp.]
HSAPAIRLGDAKPVHLGHVARADGRWRLIAFADAGDPMAADSRIGTLCAFLGADLSSPVTRYLRPGDDIDAIVDVRAVFQQPHRDLAFERMPALLKPCKGRYGLIDYEKMFCADHRPGRDIFDLRGIDRNRGCIVLLRPDQYIADVLPVDAYEALSGFFARFMRCVD